MQEPVRRALAERLRALGVDPQGHAVTFATRAGSPVVHVAVRGPVADGKDYAYFHREHGDLGADVARAAGAVVWAYAYENRVGTEGVSRFEPDGTCTGSQFAEWDEVASELAIDFDEPGARGRLLAALPLGVLAKGLGVPRELLDMALAYETAGIALPLVGDADDDELARYLRGPLAPMPVMPPMAEEGATQPLYFPSAMADEAIALAQRLGIPVGRVFVAAWEIAKPKIFPSAPGIGPDGQDAPPLPTPPSRPTGLRVDGEAPAVEALPASNEKVKLWLALPEAMLDEVRQWAVHLDRSQSWCVQCAYNTARPWLRSASVEH